MKEASSTPLWPHSAKQVNIVRCFPLCQAWMYYPQSRCSAPILLRFCYILPQCSNMHIIMPNILPALSAYAYWWVAELRVTSSTPWLLWSPGFSERDTADWAWDASRAAVNCGPRIDGVRVIHVAWYDCVAKLQLGPWSEASCVVTLLTTICATQTIFFHIETWIRAITQSIARSSRK